MRFITIDQWEPKTGRLDLILGFFLVDNFCYLFIRVFCRLSSLSLGPDADSSGGVNLWVRIVLTLEASMDFWLTCLGVLDLGHVHWEEENATTINAVWLDLELSSCFLDQRFRDHKSETDSIWITFRCPEKFSKLFAKLRNLGPCNAFSIVAYLHQNLASYLVIACNDPHVAIPCELNCILD